MMSYKLLEVDPCELRFIIEPEKQSSCTIYLFNKSKHCVAFKVKTTSPKRYSVRPNISILQPKATSEVTVLMQARCEAPLDMQCKDKFLVQSTIISSGTTEEDLTPSTFARDNAKYIEEIKLLVVLSSPDFPLELMQLNEHAKQETSEKAPILKDDQVLKDMEELRIGMEMQQIKVANSEKELSLANDIMEMKLKLHELESKLSKTEITITKLREDRRIINEDPRALHNELILLKRDKSSKNVQVGFPFLFVCMVAMIATTLGSIL